MLAAICNSICQLNIDNKKKSFQVVWISGCLYEDSSSRLCTFSVELRTFCTDLINLSQTPPWCEPDGGLKPTVKEEVTDLHKIPTYRPSEVNPRWEVVDPLRYCIPILNFSLNSTYSNTRIDLRFFRRVFSRTIRVCWPVCMYEVLPPMLYSSGMIPPSSPYRPNPQGYWKCSNTSIKTTLKLWGSPKTNWPQTFETLRSHCWCTSIQKC